MPAGESWAALRHDVADMQGGMMRCYAPKRWEKPLVYIEIHPCLQVPCAKATNQPRYQISTTRHWERHCSPPGPGPDGAAPQHTRDKDSSSNSSQPSNRCSSCLIVPHARSAVQQLLCRWIPALAQPCRRWSGGQTPGVPAVVSGCCTMPECAPAPCIMAFVK